MKRYKFIWIGIILILGLTVIWGGFIFCNKRADKSTEETWTDPVLKQKDYEAAFGMMDGAYYFSQEDFFAYRGLKVVSAERMLENFSHIQHLIDEVKKNSAKVNTIYLQLNPMILWESIGEDDARWKEALEECYKKVIKKNQKITFEILLSYPRISYLAALSEEEMQCYKNVYQSFAETFVGAENVFLYYVGAQQWLNSNPANYENAFKVNQAVEKNIILSVFCDRKYAMDATSMEAELGALEGQVEEYKNTVYPDLSDWSFVFIGDSIIGNDRSTCSIPGVVGALSGAKVYNLGRNGAAATYVEGEEVPSFTKITEALISGDTELLESKTLNESIGAFRENYMEGNLCFIINFGLNDYFAGCPLNSENTMDITTFTGALRTGVKQLQKEYPQAEIVIMLPTYITGYQEGTQITSDMGARLSQYREEAERVAAEQNVYCKNNYEDMGVNASNQELYLADGCHHNEWGRHVLGRQFVWFFAEKISNKERE